MNLPKDGTNQLPKAGFDWIALKVIFQGRKVLKLPLFSNFDITFSLFWHEASPGWGQWTVKRRIWLNHSKGHCQGQKGQVWLIFTYFSILISSNEVLPKWHWITFQGQTKVAWLSKGCISPHGASSYQILHETHSKSYGLSVYPITFDLGWHWKVKIKIIGY